jgi:hypothetical protein
MPSEIYGGRCKGCPRTVTFEIDTAGGQVRLTAGHEHPSCDWYKAQPDSAAVAKAVGFISQDQRSARADN